MPTHDAGPITERVVVVGMGLIGGSIALAARATGAATTVVALDVSEAVMARVRELGLADVATGDMAEALRGAGLVILCVPVGASAAAAAALAPHLEPGTVLSDTGSVKSSVVTQVMPQLPAGVTFVPAHPIAGTEFSGPDAGLASLFQARWCILTPIDGTTPSAIALLDAFWSRLGARVAVMTPEHHDRVLALTSHLPHMIAYNIVGTATDFGDETQSEVIRFSASGFRDFTRIAASDPVMWRDIFLHNREAVLEMFERFSTDLSQLEGWIRDGDGDALLAFFTRTRAIRRSIVAQGQDTAMPDFGRRQPPAG